MINERGCWMSEAETSTHMYDQSLADAIIKLFKPKSVVDIGCGNGAYTKNFIANKIVCIGFDGSPLTKELTGGLCDILDFSEKVDIGTFDLVLSLEVGEHIPAEYEQVFIDNLCNASYRYVCLSWAVEGQGGTGHVNCRSNEYITDEMDKRYFKSCPDYELLLRTCSTLPWFKNTLMAFERW